MPTLFIEGPFRVYFTSHDRGEPPHVHVERDGATIKIWLDGFRVAANNGFSTTDITRAIKIVRRRQLECRVKWNEYFGKK